MSRQSNLAIAPKPDSSFYTQGVQSGNRPFTASRSACSAMSSSRIRCTSASSLSISPGGPDHRAVNCRIASREPGRGVGERNTSTSSSAFHASGSPAAINEFSSPLLSIGRVCRPRRLFMPARFRLSEDSARRCVMAREQPAYELFVACRTRQLRKSELVNEPAGEPATPQQGDASQGARTLP